MNFERVDSLYICPWSLNDPLCKSQSLPYIQGLAEGGYKFALMTFENESFAMSDGERNAVSKELASGGIYWYPIRWGGGTALTEKLSSITSAIVTGARVIRRHRPRLLHSRSSLPVPVSLVLTRLFGLKFLYDADSVLSEEYADIGHVRRESRAFKLLAKSESMARRRADHMIVLTDVLKKRFVEEGVSCPIDVIPCCVDTDKFEPNDLERETKRRELGLSPDQRLLAYLGKPGSWYLLDETFEFFRIYKDGDPTSKLLIVTQADPIVFRELAEKAGVGVDDYFVRHASTDEVPAWLSAADAGLSLIKQVASKRGSSPVKFAEYLSCGLPVVTTDEIGDCSRVVLENGVGVVVAKPANPEIETSANRLREILAHRNKDLVSKCRNVARRVFDVRSVAIPVYLRIYKGLIGDSE